MMKRVVIGLTGMMGSGKSAVAGMLEELGAEVIDTDDIVHELYEKNWILKLRIVKRFGIMVLNYRLGINRKKLGEMVFRDAEKMKELEGIVWPFIDDVVRSRVSKSKGVVVVEAPLMKKAGAERFVDMAVLVSAPEKVRVKRLKEKGMDDARIKEIDQLQEDINKRAYDYVISNDAGIDELRQKVRKLWKEIERKYREK